MFNFSFTDSKQIAILPEINNNLIPYTCDTAKYTIPVIENTNNTNITQSNPTLCLNMIVRNESKIITRLLNSVLSIIDFYCICDTGSTDDTIEVITKFFQKNNIPGIIFSEPFKNFGYNRTVSLQKCAGKSDYVLLLDADMQLVIGPTFNKSMIKAYDFLYICQGNIYNSYHCNLRIIKNNPNNSYKGVTHEYLLPADSYKTFLHINPDILFINDIGDGGCKQDKYTRDIQLLKQGIIDEPNNPRYYFYLANSYNDISDHKTAIDFYIKRVNFGGWIEEVWYSLYRIGICWFTLKEYEKAVWYWLEAYEVHPNRVENLCLLVYTYIESPKQKHLVLINMFINVALEIINNLKPELKNTFLFLENHIYTHEIYIQKLLFNTDPLFNPRRYFTKILNHCIDPIKITNIFNKIWSYNDCITSTTSFIFTGFPCFNSCIIAYNNKDPLPEELANQNIKYIIVLINNKLDIYRLYVGIDNQFTMLPHTANPHKLYNLLIIDDTFLSYKSNSLYIGKYNSGDAVRIPTPSVIIPPSTDTHTKMISELKMIQKPKYMYTYLKENTIIYNWFPLIIGDLNGNIIHKQNTPNMFNYLTGGVNTVLYNDQYWTIAQIRIDDGIPLKLMNVFIVFDINLKLVQYSNPVLLDNNHFIVCHSLTMNTNDIVITYLIDSNIKMAIYNIDIIKTHMNDI